LWGDDLVLAVWPGELQDQARNLYGSDRAAALLRFAEETTRWFAKPRPHLAFHTSAPRQRVYLTPTIGLDEYVQQWSGGDLEHVHAYSLAELRDDLWPWLLARGYASPADAHELPRFERSLGRRAVHLRPGVARGTHGRSPEPRNSTIAARSLRKSETRSPICSLPSASRHSRRDR
jgi:hypothetical protein